MNTTVMTFTVEQVCQATELPRSELLHIVELGIVSPAGRSDADWQFDTQMLAMIRRAWRLHRQLEVDWPGIALAMQLLQQVETLQTENQWLRQRLQRFVHSTEQ